MRGVVCLQTDGMILALEKKRDRWCHRLSLDKGDVLWSELCSNKLFTCWSSNSQKWLQLEAEPLKGMKVKWGHRAGSLQGRTDLIPPLLFSPSSPSPQDKGQVRMQRANSCTSQRGFTRKELWVNLGLGLPNSRTIKELWHQACGSLWGYQRITQILGGDRQIGKWSPERASYCFCFLHETGGRMHWLDMRMVEKTTGRREGWEEAWAVIETRKGAECQSQDPGKYQGSLKLPMLNLKQNWSVLYKHI